MATDESASGPGQAAVPLGVLHRRLITSKHIQSRKEEILEQQVHVFVYVNA
jgi:hypothetical protein